MEKVENQVGEEEEHDVSEISEEPYYPNPASMYIEDTTNQQSVEFREDNVEE